MHRKLSLMFLILFGVAALTIYVSAQSQTQTQRGMGQGAIFGSSTSPYVVGNGVRAPETPVTVCTGPVMVMDGTAKCLYNAIPATGKLRIEYRNGSVSQIDLSDVKKMTVE